MGECWQEKHTQHAPSTKMECDYLNSWIKQQSLTQKSSPKMVNPRDLAGEHRRRNRRRPFYHLYRLYGLCQIFLWRWWSDARISAPVLPLICYLVSKTWPFVVGFEDMVKGPMISLQGAVDFVQRTYLSIYRSWPSNVDGCFKVKQNMIWFQHL